MDCTISKDDVIQGDNNFHSTLLKVLKGYYNDYNTICKDNFIVKLDGIDTVVKYSSSYQLRVFVSSTFTDTLKERNVILDKLLPRLKALGAQYNIEIIFIDMRYGVRDENTKDHETWLACKTELMNCITSSSGICFLSLQGYKYGYQPIPKFIPRDLYNTRY